MGILQSHMMDQENFTVKQPKSSETPPPLPTHAINNVRPLACVNVTLSVGRCLFRRHFNTLEAASYEKVPQYLMYVMFEMRTSIYQF